MFLPADGIDGRPAYGVSCVTVSLPLHTNRIREQSDMAGSFPKWKTLGKKFLHLEEGYVCLFSSNLNLARMFDTTMCRDRLAIFFKIDQYFAL